jgi:hypothetical protein
MRITPETQLQLKRREVPMAERNGGNFRLFSLRELHLRLEFLIITPMGEHHFDSKTAQRSRDHKTH